MTALHSFGIDVSKHHLDLASETRTFKRYENTPSGIRELANRLLHEQPDRITVESTGIYSLPLCEACAEHGLPIVLAQPRRVRDFARSQGQLAKNDAIDARIIAQFGRATPNLRPFVGPSPEQKSLRAMIGRRDQLIEDRVREEGRLEACLDQFVRKELRATIARLKRQIATWDKRIDQAIQEDAHLQAKQNALISVTGVAAVTSSVLLAYLPELGSLNRQEIAAIAGIAPYDHESGNMKGRRAIYGGRQRVRKALYMAAKTAALPKNNSPLAHVFKRLIANGKPYKVAIIALARKLLIHLNSLLKELNTQQAAVHT